MALRTERLKIPEQAVLSERPVAVHALRLFLRRRVYQSGSPQTQPLAEGHRHKSHARGRADKGNEDDPEHRKPKLQPETVDIGENGGLSLDHGRERVDRASRRG